VTNDPITLATKPRMAKRELSLFGDLRGGLCGKSVRRIGPCCGYHQSDIAAIWLPEGPGLITS